ncbi:hypothetical protein [Hymenobacter psychrophilus]|uniref:Glycosyltransferase RgtA/B/C/D-like domain-containing protein n=1 Tax=Hymenobacter psychrophilus TaxID=651662 RepID=A0A1H3BZQ6_9BACT|nr:hypothetical protein [Hymenobacter psychrophilus]SDX47422.1 hypothetical protein SAMN04488069_101488 [Hymenobacter psychrophilus]
MRRRLWILLLPLGLLLLSGGLLGTYFETNDDLAILGLVRGATAANPQSDLYLYFHGYAALWTRLYAAWPLVPWYGLTLYGLLYAATVLVVAVLNQLLQPHLRPVARALVLGLLFGLGWLEHGFWFNYSRVPLLLAGAALLYTAARYSGRGWRVVVPGLLLVGAAAGIRPGGALLGLLAAAPAAWWLGGRPTLGVLAGQLLVVGALALVVGQGENVAAYRRFDTQVAFFNDYRLSTAPAARRLTAPTDRLALAAARRWMYSDSTLTSEAFFERLVQIRPAEYLRHTAPAKLGRTLLGLGRDYFPLLLLLGLSALAVVRGRPAGQRLFWVVQLGFVGLLLGLGTLLKLPPRAALPLLDFWVLANLVFVVRQGLLPRWPLAAGPARVAGLALLLATAAYAYKTAHRRQMLAQEQATNEQQQRRLLAVAGGSNVLVTDGLAATYKSNSPFAPAPWPAGPHRILPLAGWPTYSPAQPRLLAFLTGTRAFVPALLRLARQPDVAWVLTPGGARVLNAQLMAADTGCRLAPVPGPLLATGIRAYKPVFNSLQTVPTP